MRGKFLSRIEILVVSALLLFVIAVFCSANLFHYLNYMESDVGGDAVLAKVIVESGIKVPDTWASSTELRTVSASNLAAVFYLITGNMNLSMGIACSVLLLCLTLVMICFYAKLGMEPLAVAMAVLVPYVLSGYVHEALEMFALYACYYSPHIIALFLCGILYICAKDKENNKKYLYYGFILVISFLIGTQGMRGALMAFIPIAVVEFAALMPKMTILTFERLEGFICAFLSVIAAFIASKISGAPSVGTTRNIRNGLNKLFTVVIPQMLDLINAEGYRLPVILILSILAIIGFIKAINKYKEVFYILFSLGIMLLAGAFTTTETTSRYFVMVLFAIGAGCGIFMNHLLSKERTELFSIPVLALVAFISVSSLRNYNNLLLFDMPEDTDEKNVIAFLEDNGYIHGHATFDYANMFTALSNGTITVSAIDNYDNLKGTKWLSNAIWYPPYIDADVQTFYICTDATSDIFKNYLDANKVDTIQDYYESGKYKVYVLDKDYSYWSQD
ncbi:MAG: hypothetical protein K6A23_00625 [Butyrivibrio sp.]|nr:hypothetical protein [Butyrivibrio sp.]